MTRPNLDYTSRDASALQRALLDVAREKLPLWTDHSPNDLGVVLLDAFAYLGDLLFYYQDRIAGESYLETAVEPRSVVHLLRLIGYELEPSKPAAADLFLLFDGEREYDGPVVIPSGAELHTTRESAGEVIRFRYLGPDLPIELGSFERPAPNVIAETIDGRPFLRWGLRRDGDAAEDPALQLLPVRQVDRAVSREVIGSSDGSPGQRFALAHAPVIDDTLQIFVREGDEDRAWQRVNTLLFSQPVERHYQVRRDENQGVWIELGTGTQGRIPPAGVDNIRATYLVGGGRRGNVAPNTIVKPGEGTAGIPGLRRSGHDEPASGGGDRERLELAAERAPRQFRSQNRAVTTQDYEAHARELGVAKARAFVGAWNRVDLFVAPAGGGLPSKTLKEQLLRHLDERRVLTTIVQVRDPEYVEVEIVARLTIEPTYFTHQVKQAADQALRRLLAFDRVDFGQVIYVSKLYEAVEAIEGVRGVAIERFQRSGFADDMPDRGRLVFGAREIPVLAELRWEEVTGGLRAG